MSISIKNRRLSQKQTTIASARDYSDDIRSLFLRMKLPDTDSTVKINPGTVMVLNHDNGNYCLIQK